MKYFLIVIAVIIAIPALIYLIGLFLPESHTASLSRTFDQPSHELWKSIVSIQNYPEWRSNVEKIEILSDSAEPLQWREYYNNNDPLTFEELSRSDNRQFVVRIADNDLPFGGSWTYTIEFTNGLAELTITENGEVYNPIFRFVSRFIIGHTSTIEQYINDLEIKFKSDH